MQFFNDPPVRQRQQPVTPFAGDPEPPHMHDLDRYGIDPPIMAKNVSGAVVPLGSAILFTTASTTERWFDTSTTLGDHDICGVTLDTASIGQVVQVKVDGYVRRVRTTSGTTRGQWLRQSTTVGVFEGTAQSVEGSHALALTNRDAAGYVEALIMPGHGASTAYEATTIAGTKHTLGGDFMGRVATINSSERYVSIATGTPPTTPTFQANATNGLTEVPMGDGTATQGDVVGIRFSSTFTPRSAEDWGYKCFVRQSAAFAIATNGDEIDVEVGLFAAVTAGIQNGVYLRYQVTRAGGVNTTGHWFLVSRNAGTATTVDLGAAPGTTHQELEFRFTAGGTSIQAYLNNILTGAAITTNIPTGLLIPAARVDYRVVGGGATPAGTFVLEDIFLQDGF